MDNRRRKEVVDDNNSPKIGGELAQKRRQGFTEMEDGVVEGKKWSRGGVRRNGAGWRSEDRRDVKVMEMDHVVIVGVDMALDLKLGLAVVGRGTGEMDGDAAGGDEVGEGDELIEMALQGHGYHDNHHL